VSSERVARHPHVLWRRSLDAVLVLPLAGDEPVVLTGSDVALWQLLLEPRTIEELCDLLDDANGDVAPDVGDVRDVVDRLLACGALLTDGSASGPSS
jgi:hypothetical protein